MKATPEQIKEWKQKHGEIFALTVEGKTAYLKTPDRKTLSYAMTFAQTDPLKFAESILNNCWIDGDEEIRTNDILFLSVASQLNNLVELKEAELVKL